MPLNINTTYRKLGFFCSNSSPNLSLPSNLVREIFLNFLLFLPSKKIFFKFFLKFLLFLPGKKFFFQKIFFTRFCYILLGFATFY